MKAKCARDFWQTGCVALRHVEDERPQITFNSPFCIQDNTSITHNFHKETMLGLIFLVLTAVVAAQTKPPKETFATFITTDRKNRITSGTGTSSSGTSSTSTSGGGVSRWLNRNIIAPLTGPRVPEHTVTDYYFFQIATLLDGSGQYLGAFHQWWTISELQEVGSSSGGGERGGSSNAQGLLETQAEARKQEAVQAKIKKDCKCCRDVVTMDAKDIRQQKGDACVQVFGFGYVLPTNSRTKIDCLFSIFLCVFVPIFVLYLL